MTRSLCIAACLMMAAGGAGAQMPVTSTVSVDKLDLPAARAEIARLRAENAALRDGKTTYFDPVLKQDVNISVRPVGKGNCA